MQNSLKKYQLKYKRKISGGEFLDLARITRELIRIFLSLLPVYHKPGKYSITELVIEVICIYS